MNQKILIIVGIVFALVFVLIMAIMMNTITNEANNANDQLTNVLGMTGEVNSGSFKDGATVTGDELINAINNRTIIDPDIDVAIKVITGMDTTGTVYTADQNYSKPSDANDKTYINPDANFDITESTKHNGVVTEITATQKK